MPLLGRLVNYCLLRSLYRSFGVQDNQVAANYECGTRPAECNQVDPTHLLPHSSSGRDAIGSIFFVISPTPFEPSPSQPNAHPLRLFVAQ